MPLWKFIYLFMHTSFRISGNAASDKNIKDGVCAQIEKNFAKAKWKVKQSCSFISSINAVQVSLWFFFFRF